MQYLIYCKLPFLLFFVKEEVIVARISGLKSRLVKLCVKLLQSKKYFTQMKLCEVRKTKKLNSTAR